MIALFYPLSGAALGAIFGSFLATVILRWPQGRSALVGRSACDRCGRALRPHELVPILSAIMQRGRCRTCGGSIEPLHLQVELACAVAGGVAFWLAPGIEGAGWAVLAWALLPLAILDWRHFWLPDALTLPLAFLGFTLGQWVTDVATVDRVIGAIAGYLSLLAISLGYRALRGREGLGLGDAKLFGALGAWFGWQALPFLALGASVMGLAIVAVGAASGRNVSAATRVPLGAFLCAAAIPAWFATRILIYGYGAW